MCLSVTPRLCCRPQAESSAVQSMGHAKAEARARAEAAQIEMQGMLEQVLTLSLTY